MINEANNKLEFFGFYCLVAGVAELGVPFFEAFRKEDFQHSDAMFREYPHCNSDIHFSDSHAQVNQSLEEFDTCDRLPLNEVAGLNRGSVVPAFEFLWRHCEEEGREMLL